MTAKWENEPVKHDKNQVHIDSHQSWRCIFDVTTPLPYFHDIFLRSVPQANWLLPFSCLQRVVVTYLNTYAPPAITFLHRRHFQIPVASRLILHVDDDRRREKRSGRRVLWVPWFAKFPDAVVDNVSPDLQTCQITAAYQPIKPHVQLSTRNLRILSAKWAVILGVLCHFHLLDDLSECCTVSGTILAANSNLLRVLAHFKF